MSFILKPHHFTKNILEALVEIHVKWQIVHAFNTPRFGNPKLQASSLHHIAVVLKGANLSTFCFTLSLFVIWDELNWDLRFTIYVFPFSLGICFSFRFSR